MGSLNSAWLLCAGAILLILHLPNKIHAQMPMSSYPVSDPAFIAGYKNLLNTIRLSFHSGLGSMVGSPAYLGTFAPALPPLGAPAAAGAKKGGSAAGGDGSAAGGGDMK